MTPKKGCFYHFYLRGCEQLFLVEELHYATNPHEPDIEPTEITTILLAAMSTDTNKMKSINTELYGVNRIVEVPRDCLPLYINWDITSPELAKCIKGTV